MHKICFLIDGFYKQHDTDKTFWNTLGCLALLVIIDYSLWVPDLWIFLFLAFIPHCDEQMIYQEAISKINHFRRHFKSGLEITLVYGLFVQIILEKVIRMIHY